MEADQCRDTHEDLMTIILEEVRDMRTSFEERFSALEKFAARVDRQLEKISYDLTEADSNIRALVNAYQNQQQMLAIHASAPPTPLAVVKGGKGDNDAEG